MLKRWLREKIKRLFLSYKKRLRVHPIHGVTSEQCPARSSGCEAVLWLGRTRTDYGLIGKIIKEKMEKRESGWTARNFQG